MRPHSPFPSPSPETPDRSTGEQEGPALRVEGHLDPLSPTAITGILTDRAAPGAPVRIFLRIGDHTVAETQTRNGSRDGRQVPPDHNFSLSLTSPHVRRRLSRAMNNMLAVQPKVDAYLRCQLTDGETLDLVLFEDDETASGWGQLGFDRRDGRDLLSATPNIVETRSPPKVEFICFYLPQFHPIKENDLWWGPGFTEWTNVARMQKQFPSHNAPWLPADLGFYDIRLKETRRSQAELAKQYGITGFCYYVYWFQGRRLLERPLQLMLEDGEPDIPFCICWANENWSRRWDGSEADLLIGQHHSIDADKRYIDDMAPLLADERYIRVNGKLLILIYRPALIPSRDQLFDHWRRRAHERGLGELLICNVMTFGEYDPAPLGCDAAVEFPPHTAFANELTREAIEAPESYKGAAYDYADVVRSALGRSFAYNYFPGVMPRWDNTPRKGPKGNVFVNSSPDLFEIWLRDACRRALTQPYDRKLVFINSWNEWAEGAHLEPDSIHGRAYLDAVRRVASGTSPLTNFLRNPDAINLLSREELERALRQSLFFNETLGSFIQSTPAGTATTRRIQPGLPDELEKARSIEGSMLIIDAINHSAASQVTVSQSMQLIVKGASFVSSDFAARHARTGILLLRSTTSEVGAHHFVDSWQARPDIASEFAGTSTDNFYGFECRCDLNDATPGRYRIHLLEFCENGPCLLTSDRIVDIVRR